MPELKPCPFCGETNNKIEVNRFGFYFIRCKECEGRTGNQYTEKAAIAAWNKRVKEGEE